MSSYNNFFGIDIGKFEFFVSLRGEKTTKQYENSSEGVNQFIKDFKKILPTSLCILETTGGFETLLLYSLSDKKIAVHRADTRKVKNFIRSYGNGAKTDSLDAKALAEYGFERQSKLNIFVPQSKRMLELYELVQRRKDLKQMIIAEKNRLKAPRANLIKASCEKIIEVITKEIATITAKINAMIDGDPVLQSKKEVLKTIAGIGDIVAAELLITLPELGTLDRRKIASLAGLAPKANDSGRSAGYRRTAQGRNSVKPILFLAAMAARRSKSELKTYYEQLINRGKKKMVALTALMRKIIVIANARLKSIAFC